MKILLIDKGGYFLDFALRCVEAGHDVRWFLGTLKGGLRNPQGDGMGVRKVNDWHPSMMWADIILLPDNSVYMDELEPYHRRGCPIWGPNKEIAAWELTREKGFDALKSIGADLIPSVSFSRIDDAIAHLKAKPRRYVSKLDDDNDTKAMSYVSKSAKDMLFMLEKLKKLGAMKGNFILQEFIPGTEFSVGGWFGRGGFSDYWCENFEHKKLMDGEIGPNTGEMGTVLYYTKTSTLAERLLRPLEGELYRAGYMGYIDVAVMVALDGTPYPLEFTTRPGWPLFEIQSVLHPEPVEWMHDMLHGKNTFKPKEGIACGVVMAMPDFPYCTTPQVEKCGYPVYGWEKVPSRHMHLTQVCMGTAPGENLKPEPMIVTAGECVCTITGVGPTVRAAADMAYANMKKVELPNSPIYRTDIGKKLEKALPALQKHGFAEGVKYE